LWTQIENIRAALEVARLTNNYYAFNHMAPTLSSYLISRNGTYAYDPKSTADCGGQPGRHWDDNGIVGMVLLQAHAQLRESGRPGPGYLLPEARQLWPFFQSGQATVGGQWGQWPMLGGQHEHEAPPPAVSVGATSVDDQTLERLYLASPADPLRLNYLQFVLQNDCAIKTNLRAPGGLYWGGYFPNLPLPQQTGCEGQPVPPPGQLPTDPHVCARMSCNIQGLMIGSDVLLYRITRDQAYLQSAITTANAALDFYTLDLLWPQTPIFVADYFAGLLQLDQYYHDPRICADLEAYLHRAWTEGRDVQTGLFNQNGIGNVGLGHPPHSFISGLDQAPFVIMYSLLASVLENNDCCCSVSTAWSNLRRAYRAHDSTTYAAALECLRVNIPFEGTAEVADGVSIGHFCSGGNNSITGPFPTGTEIACADLPNGVVAYTDNFATCTGSCPAP